MPLDLDILDPMKSSPVGIMISVETLVILVSQPKDKYSGIRYLHYAIHQHSQTAHGEGIPQQACLARDA